MPSRPPSLDSPALYDYTTRPGSVRLRGLGGAPSAAVGHRTGGIAGSRSKNGSGGHMDGARAQLLDVAAGAEARMQEVCLGGMSLHELLHADVD